MRIILTGATGFLGGPTLLALAAAGAEVHAVARRASDGRARWWEADLLDLSQAAALVKSVRPEIVLHLGWCVDHGRFWTDPANAAWAGASVDLAEAAARAGVTRFVGVGTCYEYDWPSDAACSEDATPLSVHTPYDRAKAECRGRIAAALAGRAAVAWARPFYLYGVGENPLRLVASVASALVRGEPALCSRGRPIRDFMDVAKAREALAALALSKVEGAVNIATGQGVRVADLIVRLGELAGRPDLVRLGALADRADEPPRIVADIRRLSTEVGYAPSTDLDGGLERTLAYWRTRGQA